jgi:predicted PurR-regulated permease PerM
MAAETRTNEGDRAIVVTETETLTRRPLQAKALIALSLLMLGLAAYLALPFVPALAWSAALAIAAHPLHRFLRRAIPNPNLAAGVAVFIVAAGGVAPLLIVGDQLGRQLREEMDRLGASAPMESWDRWLSRTPLAQSAFQSFNRYVDWRAELPKLVSALRDNVFSWLQGTVWTAFQILVTLFLLFYAFRDRHAGLALLREHAPLSRAEMDEVANRVASMIHATVFGTIGVASIQGILGGLMFWALGLPAPVLWGAVMTIFAIIPVFGAFVVWLPAAAGLALQGESGKALILAIWGTCVVSLIDNLLYPMLVGKEVRMHTVPVFIAIGGGLICFGVSGLVLGPAIFALAIALLDVIKTRTEDGGSLKEPIQ